MAGLDKDFIENKIKSIPIRRVCEALRLERRNKRYRCVNPLHPDKDPSMTVYEKSNTWYCFACGEHGSVIDMVKLACKCNFIDACEWLAHNFGILLPDKSNWRNTSRNVKPVKKTSQIKSETKAPNIDHELLEWIVTNGGISNLAKSFLYDERKLSEEVISECRIFSLNDEYRFISKLVSEFGEKRCIDSKILFRDRDGKYRSHYLFPALAFPYYDHDGKIVNIQSRTFFPKRPQDRFRNIPGLPVSIFNMNSLNGLDVGTPVYIAEGVTDCLAMLSDGHHAIAIPGANNYKDEFAKYLERFVLTMFPDNDKPGAGLYDKMLKNLKCSIFKREIPDGFKDYAEYHISRYE